MPRVRDVREQFYGGVVKPEFEQNLFDQQSGGILRTGKNLQITDAGTLKRRPGFLRRNTVAEGGRFESFTMPDGTVRWLFLSSGNVRVYGDDGTLEATMSAPWNNLAVDTLSVAKSTLSSESALYVAHQSVPLQVVAFDGTNWSISAFAFRQDPNGRKATLLARFADDGVTMSLSHYSGTGRTMTFSAPVLEAGHVGVTFAYMGLAQIQVTAVTSPTQATVNIIDTLYPSVTLGISNTDPFVVGDTVLGDVTSTRAQVISKTSSTVTLALRDGYSTFSPGDGTVSGENLVSPYGAEEIESESINGSPSATNIWLEEVISSVRGYPGTLTFHRGRLCIAGFPQLGNYFAASGVSAPDDFDIAGGEPADAMFETIGADPDAQIEHLVSSDSLLVLSADRVFYVAESQGRRFIPNGISIVEVERNTVSTVPPEKSPEGVTFTDATGRVMLIQTTGEGDQPYRILDIGQFAGDIIKTPKQLVYAEGFGGTRRRALFVINTDGTAAVLFVPRGGEVGGWTEWARGSGGTFETVASWRGDVVCASLHGGTRFVEKMSEDSIVDSAVTVADTVAQANEVLHALSGSQVLEQITFDANGSPGTANAFYVGQQAGYDFHVDLEPSPLFIRQAGRQRRRVPTTWVDVLDTGTLRINNAIRQNYQNNSDVEAPPSVVSRVYRASQLGGGEDRTVRIEQREGEGAPFHLRSLTMEVFLR